MTSNEIQLDGSKRLGLGVYYAKVDNSNDNRKSDRVGENLRSINRTRVIRRSAPVYKSYDNDLCRPSRRVRCEFAENERCYYFLPCTRLRCACAERAFESAFHSRFDFQVGVAKKFSTTISENSMN